jgi:hypothetical protein
VRTFIVRLQHDGGGVDRHDAELPRLRGVMEEVATGLRVTFRSEAELLTALTAALAADTPDTPRMPGTPAKGRGGEQPGPT